jgi:hypothetical protein
VKSVEVVTPVALFTGVDWSGGGSSVTVAPVAPDWEPS